MYFSKGIIYDGNVNGGELYNDILLFFHCLYTVRTMTGGTHTYTNAQAARSLVLQNNVNDQ